MATGAALHLDTSDIAGTEWPLFGSVFYLWATEALQEAWETDHEITPEEPRTYARAAIEATAALVADPGHAAWVRKHWGDSYLDRQNLFYRSLLIAGLTSHAKLLGSQQHLGLLRQQVESLADELDASRHGLLDDYPGECYPTDVHTAIATIRRADPVLGTDHSAFVRRASRAFEGRLLDPNGLPPYSADSVTGRIAGRSRGCGDSFILVFAPELWPERAHRWYLDYERHYWQHRWTAAGFREFPKDVPHRDWYMDVDSGPVLAGHGFAACAFGLAAARANGRFDHALPLAAEMVVTSWPLAHGTLAVPRLLSSATDAPYLGEVGVLFCLTRSPSPGVAIQRGGRIPLFVYLVLLLYLTVGVMAVLAGWRGMRSRPAPGGRLWLQWVQVLGWLLLVTATIGLAAFRPPLALLLLLLAQFLLRPGKGRHKPPGLLRRMLRRSSNVCVKSNPTP